MADPWYVVFVHGPAAAGKHTVGSLVAERLGVPLFHNHLTVDLVRTLFEFGSEPFVRLREDIWRAAFAAAARARRSFVFTFNPESTVDPELPAALQQVIEAGGGSVHYVALLCADAEVTRRLGNASRARFGKLTDPDLYRRLRREGGFDFPPLPAPLVTIDTEQTSPDEAAARIVEALDVRL